MKENNKILIAGGISLVGLIAASRLMAGPVKASVAFENYFGKPQMLSTSYPRGVRNNNPGNIRFNAKNNWKNRIPYAQNTDKSFEQFYKYTDGLRALIILLNKYYTDGYNTIEKILTKYAPATENNTAAYIDKVASAVGVRKNRVLPTDKATLLKLIRAIVTVENGGNYLHSWQFDRAYTEAKKSYTLQFSGLDAIEVSPRAKIAAFGLAGGLAGYYLSHKYKLQETPAMLIGAYAGSLFGENILKTKDYVAALPKK